MVNEFKLTVVHCMPKPDADLCWTKNCGKSGLGLRAAGPSQAASRGPRAVGCGPLGLWARLLGCGGPWAVGLLLAKPRQLVDS